MEVDAKEIELIFREAAEGIADFPIGLKETGLALLDRCHPLRSKDTSNRISYMLPYWIGEVCGDQLQRCRDLAVGNIYAMLHFFLLDDLMDGGESRVRTDLRGSLALSELLNGLFLQQYSHYFTLHSSLWSYYRQYHIEWATAVYGEMKAPADPYHPSRLASKAAPVKLCAACLLLRAGREGDLPLMEEAIELTLAVLQLSDDWADWVEDLPEGQANAFLTLVQERLKLGNNAMLSEKAVKQAIYQLECLEQLAGIVEGYSMRLRQIHLAPPKLVAFQGSIVQGICRDRDEVKAWTDRLAVEGGISHFLNNMKNDVKT